MSNFLLQLRWNGRFGNRMFQYAYGATYARLTGRPYARLSGWKHEDAEYVILGMGSMVVRAAIVKDFQVVQGVAEVEAVRGPAGVAVILTAYPATPSDRARRQRGIEGRLSAAARCAVIIRRLDSVSMRRVRRRSVLNSAEPHLGCDGL